jgi:peptide deformylase
MKSIVHTPNQVLTSVTKNVIKIDRKTLNIIKDMKDALELADHPKGVGLAASQIGIPLRIFLIKPQEKDPTRTFINPVFIKKSKTTLTGIPGKDHKLEGCLSIPKVWGIVKRHKSVTVSYLNERGEKCIETFTGFQAIIIQHEMDHLDGILFSRRVIEQQGQLYKSGVGVDGKEILEPMEI